MYVLHIANLLSYDLLTDAKEEQLNQPINSRFIFSKRNLDSGDL